MATTSPTGVIHKATLITTALLPVYNHVLMVRTASGAAPYYREIQQFLWTKHVDGQPKQKRGLVAEKRL